VRALKRVLTAVLAVLLVFAFTPFAHAQITKDQYYARSTLSGDEIEFYDHVYDESDNGVMTIYPDAYGVNETRAREIIEFVWNDSPELLNEGNIYSDAEIQMLQERINNETEKILSFVSDDMTDYEKLKVIYVYLGKSIEYNEETERAINNGERGKHIDESQTIVGGLVNGDAVCAGMARSLQYLLYQIDIPCYIVTGTGHAWNIIQLDGQWYNADLTKDGQYIKYGMSEISKFLWGDEYFYKGDYYPGDKNPPLPECPENYEPPEPAPTPTPEPTEQAVEVNVLEPTETPAEGLANRDNGLLPWVGGLAAVLVALVVLLIRRKRK
jgi:hypothetical protein